MSGVELVIGGWFATTAISKFVNKADDYLAENRTALKEKEKILYKLRNILPAIEAILEEAAKQPIENKSITKWLECLTDAAYEAEDLLDDFEAKHHKNFNGKRKFGKAASSIAKGAKKLFLTDNDVIRLREVFNKIADLYKNSKTFLSVQAKVIAKDPSCKNNSKRTPILQLDQLFGRDSEIKSILGIVLGYEIDSLEHEPSSSQAQKLHLKIEPTESEGNYGRPFVIPIFGISGVGKTALAQNIYSHQELKEYFVIKKWFYTSHEFDINQMAMDIVENFDLRNSSDDLRNKLIEQITGKRILLVLDDVCTKFGFELKDNLNLFSSVAYGSVILVTTKEKSVAENLETISKISTISLDKLEWKYFLQLLEYYAFRNANMTNEKREALKAICEIIGDKLPRLPLVAELVGNLLSTNINQCTWESISRLPLNKLDNDISSIIKKCYLDLNLELRRCFVFCLVFPRNYIMEKDRIVQMWIANSFIQDGSNEDSILEDQGSLWFHELVRRSFFLPTPWEDKYIMHSEVREIARAFFSSEAFVYEENPNPCPEKGCFLLDGHSDPCDCGYSVIHNGKSKVPDTTRYLTQIKRDLDLKLETSCYNKLRTLLFYADYFVPSLRNSSSKLTETSSSMLTKTTKLRVLVLSFPGKGAESHLRYIGKLSHLRFLDLSFTGITELPESLCNLCHLQVLDIRGCEFKRLPKKMHRLRNLRHLYASFASIDLFYKIGKLTLLRELEQFRVSQEKGHTVCELANLNEIGGHLSIIDINSFVCDYDECILRLYDKTNLKSLSLSWNGGDFLMQEYEFEVLNSLRPHPALEKLEIVNYPGKLLPSWTSNLVKIRRIHLKGCYNVNNLPPFGKIPCLETFILEDLPIEYIGQELYGDGEIFPKLKVLKFVAMTTLKEWQILSPSAGERKFFPCLEELEIRDCNILETRPDLCSLELPCLKKLELLCCTKSLVTKIICGKLYKLLSYLYISGTPSEEIDSAVTVNLSYPNFPNLQTLSLEHMNVQFEGNQRNLSNLKRLILNMTQIKWNGEADLPKLTEIEMQFAAKKASEMAHILLTNFGDLSPASLCSVKILRIKRLGYNGGNDQSEWLSNEDYRKCLYILEGLFRRSPHLVELSADNIGIQEVSFASLTSLKTLHLEAIKSIHEGSMPRNLKELYIYDASDDLKRRCSPVQGEDWPKIRHIPYIRVIEKKGKKAPKNLFGIPINI